MASSVHSNGGDSSPCKASLETAVPRLVSIYDHLPSVLVLGQGTNRNGGVGYETDRQSYQWANPDHRNRITDSLQKQVTSYPAGQAQTPPMACSRPGRSSPLAMQAEQVGFGGIETAGSSAQRTEKTACGQAVFIAVLYNVYLSPRSKSLPLPANRKSGRPKPSRAIRNLSTVFPSSNLCYFEYRTVIPIGQYNVYKVQIAK